MSLYITDGELATMLGVGRAKLSALVRVWEKSGFPPKDPQVSSKRYLPAVRAWLDRRHGLASNSAGKGQRANFAPDGEENWQ